MSNYNMDISDYIESHSTPESDLLRFITRDTYCNVLNPRMVSGHIQGRLLSMISRMIQPKHILELGTFTGYSALCLAEGLPEDGLLTTVEHNDELEDTIRRNLALSPLNDKIHLVIQDAKTFLEEQKQPFDLIFIDADKREYCAYLDLLMNNQLLPVGGWLLADNTLWDGHIIDPDYDRDQQTIALRRFNDQVAADPRLDKLILPLRDGLTIIQRLS
ncbi:MAG: O-methyltransferase [Paludibacteraceae bacterium]|nr:O-methyltransferase [Paludibacteraceae bacterium]